MKIHCLARPPSSFAKQSLMQFRLAHILPGLSVNDQAGNETLVLATSYQADCTAYADISISAGKGNGNQFGRSDSAQLAA
jgi:hypothetical protein